MSDQVTATAQILRAPSLHRIVQRLLEHHDGEVLVDDLLQLLTRARAASRPTPEWLIATAERIGAGAGHLVNPLYRLGKDAPVSELLEAALALWHRARDVAARAEDA